jgi:hypothetical protein
MTATDPTGSGAAARPHRLELLLIFAGCQDALQHRPPLRRRRAEEPPPLGQAALDDGRRSRGTGRSAARLASIPFSRAPISRTFATWFV